MNDRELLELAAKAAGIGGAWGERAMIGQDEVDLTDLWFMEDTENCVIWNPLTDDGDALRLAVKLPHLNLQWIIAEAWQSHDDDELRRAYVRRAIVRAAAEIGRSMP